MNDDRARQLSAIRLLILDVDGVLTDGGIIVHSDGTESKRFHVQDGHGIKLWHRAGGITAIVSGRTSGPTEHRARQLDIAHVVQGKLDKLPAMEELLRQLGLGWEQAAVIGDDVVDIPTVRRGVRRGGGQRGGGVKSRRGFRDPLFRGTRGRTGGDRVDPQDQRPMGAADGTI